MNYFKILVWFDSPQVKRYMKSSTKKLQRTENLNSSLEDIKGVQCQRCLEEYLF